MGVGLLLDTCALLSMADITDGRFSPEISRRVLGADPLCMSAISVYELGIKWRKGNLVLDVEPEIFWDACVRSFDLAVIPIDADVLIEAYSLPPHHRDPFDRMIIAQAVVSRIPVVTFDTTFAQYAPLKDFELLIAS